MSNNVIHRVIGFIIAAVATGATASVVQTQINLLDLARLGVPISASIRALVALEDLARFGPVMVGIAAAATLLAILGGYVASRWTPPSWRTPIFTTAGFVALWVTFLLLGTVTPMPALVVATRDPEGLFLVCLAGLIGGWIYARLTRPGVASARPRVLIGAMLIVLPALLFLVMAPRKGAAVVTADPASYAVETIASGLDRPWSVAFLPDGRRLVTESAGRLLAIGTDGVVSNIALDKLPHLYHPKVAGLMEIAVDPQFAENSFVYLTMGYGELGANGTRLMRATLSGDRLENVHVLFSSTLKPSGGNNGGRIAFLRDGTLVLTVGDGSDRREEGQNLSNHLGKLVRLDRDGRPPADNPFLQTPGAAPEIYSLGHRNAQGIALDPATGELLITEHGPRGGDEVNVIAAGANYGWPILTGGIDYSFARVTPFRRLAGYADPALEWTPSIAPAGLAIYDGSLFPDWRGDLFVPALKERSVRRVRREQGRIVGQELLLAELGERMRDVKVAPDGSIYVLTDGPNARLLRLVP